MFQCGYGRHPPIPQFDIGRATRMISRRPALARLSPMQGHQPYHARPSVLKMASTDVSVVVGLAQMTNFREDYRRPVRSVKHQLNLSWEQATRNSPPGQCRLLLRPIKEIELAKALSQSNWPRPSRPTSEPLGGPRAEHRTSSQYYCIDCGVSAIPPSYASYHF